MKRSLAAQLLRAILSIYFIIAVSLTLIQLAFEYRNEQNRLADEVHHIAATFKPIFAQAIWNLDDDQIRSNLEGVLINQNILGAALLDEQGKRYAALGAVEDINGNTECAKVDGITLSDGKCTERLTKLYSFTDPVIFQDEVRGDQNVGSLILYSSSDIVLQHAANTFIVTIANAALKTFCLWVIALMILNKLVARPLGQLTSAMDH